MVFFNYYLKMSVHSLSRNWGLTLLMVLSIAVGVGASVITYGVFQAMSDDPIPTKSSVLYVPQLDIWGGGNDEPVAEALSFLDAVTLIKEHRATMQAATYQITASIVPADAQRPLNVNGYAASSEFFRMFDVPFVGGAGWSAGDDENKANVVVISQRLSQQLFHGAISIGRTVNIQGKDYRIIGVLGAWDPQPRFYDVVSSGGFSASKNDIFIPMMSAFANGVPNSANMLCRNNTTGDDRDCAWISYIAQLNSPGEAKMYASYLTSYVSQNALSGNRAARNKTTLHSLRAWMEYQHVVPPDTKMSFWGALVLLLVCVVNTSGLLLAKFIAKNGEIGLRRALGATKAATSQQLLLEASLVGVAGGVVGIVLLLGSAWGMHHLLPARFAELSFINPVLVIAALGVSVIAALTAAIYPARRMAGTQPAWWIKAGG